MSSQADCSAAQAATAALPRLRPLLGRRARRGTRTRGCARARPQRTGTSCDPPPPHPPMRRPSRRARSQTQTTKRATRLSTVAMVGPGEETTIAVRHDPCTDKHWLLRATVDYWDPLTVGRFIVQTSPARIRLPSYSGCFRAQTLEPALASVLMRSVPIKELQ
eukprot:618806-Pleurochrysis_carterae.AAC.4